MNCRRKRGSVTYGTDREDEVSTIFIISLLCFWRVRERFPFMRNSFKLLKQVESKTSQFEIVFQSLARLSTLFKVKKVLNFYLLYKLRKFGDKSLKKKLAGRGGEYGPLNWPITPRVLTKRYNKIRTKLYWDTGCIVGLPKTKELVPVQPDFPLFWKSYCVTCVPA